jgi:hypothetical protein
MKAAVHLSQKTILEGLAKYNLYFNLNLNTLI